MEEDPPRAQARPVGTRHPSHTMLSSLEVMGDSRLRCKLPLPSNNNLRPSKPLHTQAPSQSSLKRNVSGGSTKPAMQPLSLPRTLPRPSALLPPTPMKLPRRHSAPLPHLSHPHQHPHSTPMLLRRRRLCAGSSRLRTVLLQQPPRLSLLLRPFRPLHAGALLLGSGPPTPAHLVPRSTARL